MSEHPADGPVVTIFRSRLRAGDPSAYQEMATEMGELARAMPGYVEHKVFTAGDGERVTLVTFADRASHDAWRDHERHGVAQRAGRREFYDEYRLQICRCEDTSTFTRPGDS
jgi:heme-degrading monooxygenase HmoA